MIATTRPLPAVDLPALADAPLVTWPFPFVIVPQFIYPEAYGAVVADFPRIEQGGSFPLSALEYGPAFRRLCQELESPELREHFARKLEIDLSDRPVTITVRGQTVQKNGSIHLDSRSKLVTVLIYLNDEWTAAGGRLRLLHSGNNLNDAVAEIAPTAGAMVAFVNTANAWHGHQPFVGPRRSIQLNWVTDKAAADQAVRRHVWSARVKNVLSLWGRPAAGGVR